MSNEMNSPMTTSNEATHDAWLIGTHPLPPDAPVGVEQSLGEVLVRTRRANGRFVVMSADQFNHEFEWITEG